MWKRSRKVVCCKAGDRFVMYNELCRRPPSDISDFHLYTSGMAFPHWGVPVNLWASFRDRYAAANRCCFIAFSFPYSAWDMPPRPRTSGVRQLTIEFLRKGAKHRLAQTPFIHCLTVCIVHRWSVQFGTSEVDRGRGSERNELSLVGINWYLVQIFCNQLRSCTFRSFEFAKAGRWIVPSIETQACSTF